MNLRKLGLIALAFALVAGISAALYHDPALTKELYGRLAYYLIAALFFLWAATIWRFLQGRGFSPAAFVRRYAVSLGFAALMTAVVCGSVAPRFRVLSDETNLVSVSQGMLYHKTVFNNTQNKFYFGRMHPLSEQVEKRPLMFPFFIHLAHLARGYHAENAFLVNALTLFALLALAGTVAEAFLGGLAAVSAILLVAAYPLVALSAASAGYDLFAAFFTALAFVLLHQFLREPSADRFALLWVNLLVFAQIRYESSVIVAVILAGILLVRKFSLSFLTERAGLYALTPFLLLPLIAQRILTPHPYENAPGTAAFSLEYLSKWTGVLFRAQTDFSFAGPHAPLLNLLGAPVAAFLLVKLLRDRRPDSRALRESFGIALAALAINLGIFLCYYFGDYTHAVSARFFLNISILAALMPVALHAAAPRALSKGGLLALACAAFVLYHPVSVQGRFTNTSLLVRESDVIYGYLQRLGRRDILAVTGRPGQVSALDYGAVDFVYANAHRESLLNELKRRLYNDILVFQRIDYESKLPFVKDRLDPGYGLESLYELQTSSSSYMRVSRVRR